jgi:hypothetical protein
LEPERVKDKRLDRLAQQWGCDLAVVVRTSLKGYPTFALQIDGHYVGRPKWVPYREIKRRIRALILARRALRGKIENWNRALKLGSWLLALRERPDEMEAIKYHASIRWRKRHIWDILYAVQEISL